METLRNTIIARQGMVDITIGELRLEIYFNEKVDADVTKVGGGNMVARTVEVHVKDVTIEGRPLVGMYKKLPVAQIPEWLSKVVGNNREWFKQASNVDVRVLDYWSCRDRVAIETRKHCDDIMDYLFSEISNSAHGEVIRSYVDQRLNIIKDHAIELSDTLVDVEKLKERTNER